MRKKMRRRPFPLLWLSDQHGRLLRGLVGVIGMERLFQFLAVVFFVGAAYFLWAGNFDGLFLAGVLGSVCFFLSIRFQIKQRLKERAEREE
jgi:hypothetical protein